MKYVANIEIGLILKHLMRMLHESGLLITNL